MADNTMNASNPFVWICAECGDEITDPTEANVMWFDTFSAPLDDPSVKREAMSAVRVTHCIECSDLDPAWRDSCSNTLGIFDGSMGIVRAALFVADVKQGSGSAPMWLLAGAYARRFANDYVWKADAFGGHLVNPVTMIAK